MGLRGRHPTAKSPYVLNDMGPQVYRPHCEIQCPHTPSEEFVPLEIKMTPRANVWERGSVGCGNACVKAD